MSTLKTILRRLAIASVITLLAIAQPAGLAAAQATSLQAPVSVPISGVSDHGVDGDGDGRYDELQVQATISMSLAGKYRLSGILRDGAGEIIDTAETTATLGLGTFSISMTLAFDGRAIERHHADGPYQASLTLTRAGGPDVATLAYTTGAYAYASFEQPDALLNGHFADSGVDTNGDGYYDLLRVDVGVDAGQTGTYSVTGALFNDFGTMIAPAEATIALSTTGTYSVSLDFPGTAIRNRGGDGPYHLAVLELRRDGSLIDSIPNAYDTHPYNAKEFQQLVTLTGVFSDHGEDSNGNGRYESLVLNIGVYVAVAGPYSFTGRLVDVHGDLVTSADGYQDLAAGVQQIELRFVGQGIYDHGVAGPYSLQYLQIFSADDSDSWGDLYATAAYSASQFEQARLMRGMVTAGGQPIAGARISVAGIGNPLTDASGAYQLLLPNGGTYAVSIVANPALAPWRISVDGAKVAQGTSANITTGPGATTHVDFASAATDPQCPPQGGDLCVQLSPANIQVVEANTTVVINATLSAPAATPVSVSYAIKPGTARVGWDYVDTNGTLTFAPGETSKSISVQIINDSIDEMDETFTVGLGASSDLVIGAPSSATVTIVDDDQQPIVRFDSAGPITTAENASSMNIPVMLTSLSTYTITVQYTTSDGTATAGSDYTTTSGILTIPPLQSGGVINVPILEDGLAEGPETILLSLSNPTNATLGTPNVTTLQINPNDSLTFEGAGGSLDEGVGTREVRVRLNAASALPVTVAYATSDGTATAGSDYVATSGTLTFAPGQALQTFTVQILEDGLPEDPETILFNLSNPANAGLGDPSAMALTIRANDRITFTQFSYGVKEDQDHVQITVHLNSTSALPVTVAYATSDGTATAGSDYVATSGTLTFAPGQDSLSFNVPIINDVVGEDDETIFLSLSNPTNAGLGNPSTSKITIDANDILTFDKSSNKVSESGSSIAVTVRLNAASAQPVTVAYATGDDTATAGSDYTATSGTLIFAPGQVTKTFNVPILNDVLDEPNETFTVALANPTNASVGTPGSTTITIEDNDNAPTLSLQDAHVTVNENAGSAEVTVILSAVSGFDVTVAYATSNGTATSPNDYIHTQGVLTFAPGETSKTITVPIVNDPFDEIIEVFNIGIFNANHATLVSPTTTIVTIIDND